jgi:hypothetical protein
MHLRKSGKHYIKYHDYRLQCSPYNRNFTFYIKALGLRYDATGKMARMTDVALSNGQLNAIGCDCSIYSNSQAGKPDWLGIS